MTMRVNDNAQTSFSPASRNAAASAGGSASPLTAPLAADGIGRSSCPPPLTLGENGTQAPAGPMGALMGFIAAIINALGSLLGSAGQTGTPSAAASQGLQQTNGSTPFQALSEQDGEDDPSADPMRAIMPAVAAFIQSIAGALSQLGAPQNPATQNAATQTEAQQPTRFVLS